MKAKQMLLMSLAALAISCQDDEAMNSLEVNSIDCPVQNEVYVTAEGYLSFSTYSSLENFLNDVQNGEETSIVTLTRASHPFKSIATMLSEQESGIKATRAAGSDMDDMDDLEEMTEDEFNLMKAERLLYDDLLTHVMDTTLRICIEGEYFRITENGTFSGPESNIAKVDSIADNFDPSTDNTETGESVDIYGDVVYTNSFGKEHRLTFEDEMEYVNEDDEEDGNDGEDGEDSNDNTSIDKSLGDSIILAPVYSINSYNEFHKTYNVDSFKWKSKTLLQKFLSWLRGKDLYHSKKFDKNHRVEMNVFDVNYKFYKSAGVKVKMQVRKKYLFVPFWVNTTAAKMVIGFNEMDGVLTYDSPNLMSNIMPTESDKWKTFKGTVNGLYGSFIYGCYYNVKFIKDWTDYIAGWMPSIEIGNKNYTDTFVNKLYDMPAKAIYSFTKNLINKTVYSNVEKKIKSTDPMMAYLIWGSSSTQFNKEHPYITGVKEYTNKSSKSVIFDRSFGVSYISGSIKPYTPSDFDIKSIDVFGAAYYNGEWVGVRFYTE